jgi:predicted RNase H-like HicB family nuclease
MFVSIAGTTYGGPRPFRPLPAPGQRFYHDTVGAKSVDRLRLTAVYEPDDNGWVYAHVLEIPGINTSAPTEAEAKEMLVDAVREFVAALADDVEREASPNARYETVEIDLG